MSDESKRVKWSSLTRYGSPSFISEALRAAGAPLCALAWAERLGWLFGDVLTGAAVALAILAAGQLVNRLSASLAHRPSGLRRGAPAGERQDLLRRFAYLHFGAAIWLALTPWLVQFAE